MYCPDEKYYKILLIMPFLLGLTWETPWADSITIHVPLGYGFDAGNGIGPLDPCGNTALLREWPEAIGSKDPLKYDRWAGPYQNGAGKAWVDQINAWHREGTAAGLGQDVFRSFDNGHSSLRAGYYPQLTFESPVASYFNICDAVFGPRVTMGVQSFGIPKAGQGTISVIEMVTQQAIASVLATGTLARVPTQRFYRMFYERNFLFIGPAAGSYAEDADKISFLSPFYLHSQGASGTDAQLLKPIVFAAAALSPRLKTRILRGGLYVPVLMYLFKSSITGNMRSPEAHMAAYHAWIEEAEKGHTGRAPFLDRLINSAHDLNHIPPVARMRILDAQVERGMPSHRPYMEYNIYGFTGALREGEKLELIVDLSGSWTDANKIIKRYYAEILRGAGTIEFLNREGSLVRVTIPWMRNETLANFRTDVLLLVHDGTYDSAPAYISIRHIQNNELHLLGK